MTMKKNETFKVAVYGTLMAGERNACWARGAKGRVPCVIRGTLYSTGYGYPAFVPDADGREVKAELLTVTDATLALLDGLEGFPWLYGHRKVKAVLEDGREVEAMAYVMNTLPRGAKVIPGGDWRRR